MDMIEIDAASNRGIDEIRELKEKINYQPVKGKKKIYIIDEVPYAYKGRRHLMRFKNTGRTAGTCYIYSCNNRN